MAITLDGTSGITSAGTIADGTATIRHLTSSTSVASTSGTSIDFTSIPSWVKRITVMLSGMSTSGTSNLLVQIGDSGGIENTGYGGGAYTPSTATANSAGFLLTGTNSAANVHSGIAFIALLDSATNLWAFNATGYGVGSNTSSSAGGAKSLSATLDRLRLTTVNGTDTFDAGSINILYE